jgi:hypothetical protein
MSSDGAKTSQVTWLYTLSTLNITLSLLVLTSRYWRRPMTFFVRRLFPYAHDQRPLTTQTKNHQATSRVPATSSANNDCPSCVAGPDEKGEAKASPSAVPLQMERQRCYPAQGPPPNPKPLNECTSLSPENFSSGNDRDTGKTRNNGQNFYECE